MKSCPNCGVSVQVGSQFCGQCGCNLAPVLSASEASETAADDFPAPLPPNPQLTAEDSLNYVLPMPSFAERSETQKHSEVRLASNAAPQIVESLEAEAASDSPFATHSAFATQIQLQSARLVHLQSNTFIELPQHLSPLHVGKPNREIPPDIDVAGFPHSEVVSRIHADIHIESGHFFIEDVGSSNGTYINSIPLRPRHQHQLRSGDRIALGKGDLVTFLFQLD